MNEDVIEKDQPLPPPEPVPPPEPIVPMPPMPIPDPPDPEPPPGSQVIRNGSFEEGNVGFYSEYEYLEWPPPTRPKPGEYTIGDVSKPPVPGWMGEPHSGSRFLVASAPEDPRFVWYLPAGALIGGAWFHFVAYCCSLYGQNHPKIELIANDRKVAEVDTAGPEPTAPEGTQGPWYRLSYRFVAEGPYVRLGLRSISTAPKGSTALNGNGFGIDSISLTHVET